MYSFHVFHQKEIEMLEAVMTIYSHNAKKYCKVFLLIQK